MGIKIIQKFINKIGEKQELQKNISKISKQIDELKYVFLPAQSTHKETFAKYKNFYKDKEIVIMGSGPTIKEYSRIKDAIHIGVNYNFTIPNINLDYLFIQDNLSLNAAKDINYQQAANKYRGSLCKKFYGIHRHNCCIAEHNFIEANAERFYFIDHQVPTSKDALFSIDISSRPLNEWSSVIFAALEFALYTHPKRIYIVGCDCSDNGHIYWNVTKDSCPYKNRLKYGWTKMKEFIDLHYPDIEIISINPVGLKGLFNDVYTKSYLDNNSEILNNEIKIL